MKRFFAGLTLAVFAAGAAGAADLSYSLKDGPAANTWTGFYVGINGGYAWGSHVTISDAWAATEETVGYNLNTGIAPEGVFGGAQAGYNLQTAGLVFGIEADIQAANIDASSHISGAMTPEGEAAVACTDDPCTGSAKAHVDWFGTLRGRAGIPLTQSLLPYATAGLAFGGISQSATTSAWDVTGAANQIGWTAGGGLEMKFADSWSGKVEYLHVDLGNNNLTGLFGSAPSATPDVNTAFDLVRVGINRRF